MNVMNRFLLTIALLLSLFAGSALAETYNLTAEAVDVTYPHVGTVPMWGFADNDAGGPATVPGPALTVTDGNLTINLTNNLPEPVSVVLPGQPLPAVSGGTPAAASMVDGLGRTRATSFVAPVAPGDTLTYTWSTLRPGTYLYESGSHIGVQVPMGLYGALAVEGGGDPYDGTLPEVTLLFSEVDVAMHQEVAGGDYGDSTVTAYTTALEMGYDPEVLLLNGQSFVSSTGLALNGETVSPGDRVLVRMLNAGLRTRAPYFLNVPRLTGGTGGEITLVAMDGYLLPSVRRQGGAELPAGTTRDIVLAIDGDSGERYIPVYDRMLGLANGGMVGAIAVDDTAVSGSTLTVGKTGTGIVTSVGQPGGIDCDLADTDCSETVLTGTTMTLHAEPTVAGDAFTGWSVVDTATSTATGECVDMGDCVVTLDEDKTVAATFATYTAVTLLAPNGGESINPDAAYMIRWAAPVTAETFSLGYSTGPNKPYRGIANGVTGSSYRWVIPADALRTGTVSVAIIGYDASGAEVGRDTSDNVFALIDSVTLVAPNGGEVLEDVGFNAATTTDPFLISWNDRLLGTTTVARTGVWLQAQTGAVWKPLAILAGNSGSYSWDVPDAATLTSGTARIGVIFYDAAGNPVLSDASDSTFLVNQSPAPGVATPAATGSVLAAPTGTVSFPESTGEQPLSLELLAPNGGEYIASDTPFTVIWESTLEAAQYGVSVSLDAGESWISLGGDLQGSQFDWQPDPDISGSNRVLLKVTAYDAGGQPIAEDVSDETFTLD